MINILVTIEVNNFDLLATFERKAAEIMGLHGGEIVRAFETSREIDGSGQEVHLLEFPSEDAFMKYRSDFRLSEHAELREKAIKSMTVIQSSVLKSYD